MSRDCRVDDNPSQVTRSAGARARILHSLLTGTAAACLARAAYAGLERRLTASETSAAPPLAEPDAATASGGPDADRWTRQNYRGRQVNLLAGPALAGAALAVTVLQRHSPGRVKLAALVAGSAAALAGSHDDVRGTGSHRGLQGHFAALRSGELTTGALKVFAIGGGGLAAGWLADRGRGPHKLAAGAVVAASANLANLLDLRPGRASKTALLAAVPLALSGRRGGATAAAAGGAAAGLLRLDLSERVMLGDAGANSLGALVGLALIADGGSRRVPVALAALLALTAASEVVSFSKVIDSSGPLRWLDQLGRLRDG